MPVSHLVTGNTPWDSGVRRGWQCSQWDYEPPAQTAYFFFPFNWKLITLYIHMNQPWVYRCFPSWAPVPYPSPSRPSGSSQRTSPEHPVPCIEPGLAIYFPYDNTHVSMLFSQIIPPSPSPTESNSLCFTSVFLLLSQRHYFANKGRSSQGYGFSSGHVWTSELDHKESWAPKNWCFWTVVLEKTLESLGLQGDPTSPS